MKTIQYAIHEDGYVVSRVGSEVAWPVLDYDAIGRGGDGYPVGNYYGPNRWTLNKIPVHHVGTEWVLLKWTKKIPLSDKNEHRKFWGMKPVKGSSYDQKTV